MSQIGQHTKNKCWRKWCW